MSRLIFAPEADDDLMEIARYIAKRNLPAAERFIDAVYDTGERLAGHPETGRARNELAPGVRSLPDRSVRALVSPHGARHRGRPHPAGLARHPQLVLGSQAGVSTGVRKGKGETSNFDRVSACANWLGRRESDLSPFLSRADSPDGPASVCLHAWPRGLCDRLSQWHGV